MSPSTKTGPRSARPLKWFVDKGPEAMYQLKEDIRVYTQPDGIYALAEGNHRSLALYILGADSIRAVVVKRKTPTYLPRVGFWSRILTFR